MQENSKKAVEFLKSLSSEHRLIILCLLVEGPKTVGELLEGTGLEQTSISQHLKKLREADIVSTTREHRTITYEIQSPLVKKILNLLHDEGIFFVSKEKARDLVFNMLLWFTKF